VRVRTFRDSTVVTRVPLGSRKAWTWATCLAASGIVASAALAQQELNAVPVIAATPNVVERPAPRIAEAASPAKPVATPSAPEPPTSAPAVREPRHEILSIAAPSNGTVEVVYVRIGDRVDAGQPLVTFNDREAGRAASQLRLEIASARARAAELEGSLKTLDATIAASTAALPAAAPADVPPEAAATVARAQAVYNEAVARERRAAALQAHGVAVTQELEAAQMAVRSAADDLALARREASAKAALASAQVVEARTEAESTIASRRSQRDQVAAEIAATRQQQREAEAALVEAAADSSRLVVRAPAAAVVTELAVQPGDRVIAASPLLKLDRSLGIPQP
jgi:multidrug resistance efflux pump